MQDFIFDLQRFATQEISAGETYELDGVTYTATTNAVFNLDDDGKVSGLASGKVQSTLTDAENSPTITFDASDDAIKFSATENDALAVTLSGRTFYFTEGTATVTSDNVSTGATKFSIAGTHSNADYKFAIENSAEFSITTEAFVISSEKFNVSVLIGGNTLEFGVSGTAIRNFTDHTFSFSGGTTISNTFGDYTFSATANDDSGGGFSFTSKGITFTPENGGKLGISIAKGDTPIFAREFSVSGGSIFVNHANQTIGLTDGAEISLSSGGYKIIAKANGDASTVFSFADNGFTFTPNTGDGTLDITIKNSAGSMTANVEILSGSFILGDGGKLTVTKGTELKIDFGGGYVVNFKATNDAGGSISLGADGITFTPNKGDGNLEISVTRDGETRTASLDMTGSLTYKLDGSISFADGTIVDLTWTDGINLKLKSRGSSGSILLDPDNGIRLSSADKNLDVILTTTDGYVTEITSIEGDLWYKAGTVTLDAGTVITGQNIVEGRNVGIRFEAIDGDASLHFANKGVTYSAGSGKNFVTYTLGNAQSSFSVNKGSVFIQGRVFHVAEGSDIATDFKDFVAAQYFMLDKEGTYMINGIKVITSSDDVQVHVIDDDTISFADDAAVKVLSDGNAFMLTGSDDAIQVKVIDNAEVTSGSITYDNATKKVAIAEGTTVSVTQGDRVIKLTAPKTISATYKVDDGISYFDLDSDATAKVSVTSGGQTVFTGDLTAGGVLSYNPASGTFGLTGANSSHGNGTNTFAQLNVNGYEVKMATNDTTVVFVPTITDGRLDINFPNERKHEMLFTLSKDGNTIMEDQAVITGTVGFDIASKELHFTKGTVLTLGSGERSLEITALDDASGQLTFTDSGIRFAPNAGDGQLELNFVSSDRKANIDVSSGALILNSDRTLSLEKGTVVNLTWEDGTKLTLTASDTGGSIGFDAQGLKVSSDGELSIDLTAGDVQTTLTGLNGTIHYNAGKVLFDKDSTLTATSTLGGQPVNITLESNGTGGYLEISAVGTNYVAGTGALAITWSRDDKSSTFSVSDGSVYIGHGIFRVAEGTTLSTDLKDLVPALYFTTTDAGTYTINGQTITTSAANLALTATDDYMTFHTSDDVVTYDGMTFAGDGNVSLTADNVVLGAGVVANGFGEGNSFVLAEAGNVTADAKIFQLDSLSLTDGREIPMVITVTGAQDGFIFSRTLTEESEEYLGEIDSPYVGSIFTEKFIAKGDNSYRIRTDPIGLEDVIGISDGATISGGATLDDEETLSYYVLVTDTTGDFTIGKKTYTIADGSELGTGIRARFDVDSAPYADKVSDLNGTISGDFTEGQFSVNGGAGIKIFGDKDVSISANDNGVEIYGLSDKATLASVGTASKVHTDTTGVFTFGEGEDDSIAITVQGDPNVTFEFDLESQDIMAINDLEGSLQLSETSHLATINGINCDFDGKFSSVGAYDNALYLHDVSDGSSIITDDEDKIWLQQVGASMAVNTNEFTLAGDEDGIWIRDKEIVGLDEGASLKVSDAGNYTVNTANISAKAGDVIVGLENGNDAYIFNANNPLITKNTSASALVDIFNPENVSIVSASDKGRFDISLSGGDLAIVENTAARVNITAGDDTVVSQGKNVHLNLTGGDTWLFALGGKMTIDGYDLSSGTGFGTTYGDIVSAVKDGRIDFGNGKLSMSGAVADFNTQSQLVNFFDRNGTRQIVGFAGNYASLNASDSTDNLLLSGDKNSTLIAGSGNDTIFAAEGNFVDAGAGKNSIFIEERDENSSGVKINLDGGGNDTVHNFKTGFDFDSDAIYSDGGLAVRLRLYDENLVASVDGGAQVTLNDVAEDDADFTEILFAMPDYTTKVAVAKAGGVIKSQDAQMYIGNKEDKGSGVDFSGTTEKLFVNLSDEPIVTDAGEKQFYGINSIAAGDGLSTLIGNAEKNTLVAGNGYGSLWGGAGDDNLIGKSDSADKNGMTSFFFFAGDGNDTVSNFEFITRENKTSGNADKVMVVSDLVTRASLSGDDVVMQLNDGDDYLTLEDAAGKDFRLNDLIVKVDKNVAYDGLANCYVADGGDSLTVDSTVDSAEIWLDSSHGTFFFGNIRTLDASAVEGRTSLAGSVLDETIIAGHGDSSLWGGNDGNDLLIGGESKNTFFYHLGNGNDTIQGAKEGDIVDLNTMTINQVVGEIGDGGVVLRFTDGGSLTVDSTDVEFRINNDGTTYFVDNGEWKTK